MGGLSIHQSLILKYLILVVVIYQILRFKFNINHIIKKKQFNYRFNETINNDFGDI